MAHNSVAEEQHQDNMPLSGKTISIRIFAPAVARAAAP